MKKISLICAVALAGLSLTACGSNSTKKASSSSKATSSKVVKHHSKKVNKSKHSSSSSANGDNQQGQQQASQQAGQQGQHQASQQAGQQTQASSNQGQPASDNGLPPSSDLHDFVNRYGESPAAYLMDHYGMSPEQAVQSVPNDMKTSGEIQDTYQLQQGQDPFNN